MRSPSRCSIATSRPTSSRTSEAPHPQVFRHLDLAGDEVALKGRLLVSAMGHEREAVANDHCHRNRPVLAVPTP